MNQHQGRYPAWCVPWDLEGTLPAMKHTLCGRSPRRQPSATGERNRRLALAVAPAAVFAAGSVILAAISYPAGGGLPATVDFGWFVVRGMVGVFLVGTGFNTRHLGRGYRWLTVVGGAAFAASALNQLMATPDTVNLSGIVGLVVGVIAPVVGWISGRASMGTNCSD